MRINTRFTVAVHMLSLIALAGSQGKALTSELIAASVGTNPVVIRQMISCLKKAGLVVTRSGVPGATPAREPEEISLLEIYRAVRKDADGPLFDFHMHPNPECAVGRNIAEAMSGPLRTAQEALEQALAGYSLRDITGYIQEKEKS